MIVVRGGWPKVLATVLSLAFKSKVYSEQHYQVLVSGFCCGHHLSVILIIGTIKCKKWKMF